MTVDELRALVLGVEECPPGCVQCVENGRNIDALIAAVRAEERERCAADADLLVSVHADCIARENGRASPDDVLLSLHRTGQDTARTIAARIRGTR